MQPVKQYYLPSKIIATLTAVSASFASSAAAGDIVLQFHDNPIAISGEFIGFEQEVYVLRTSAGIIHIPAKYVSCTGEDCLEIVPSNDGALLTAALATSD